MHVSMHVRTVCMYAVYVLYVVHVVYVLHGACVACIMHVACVVCIVRILCVVSIVGNVMRCNVCVHVLYALQVFMYCRY